MLKRKKFVVGDKCMWCKKGILKEAPKKDLDNVVRKIGKGREKPAPGMIIKCDNSECSKVILSGDLYRKWIASNK